MDKHADRLLTSELWRDWWDRLKAVGERICESDFPSDERTRAGGYRSLTRVLGDATRLEVEARGHRSQTDLQDLGRRRRDIPGDVARGLERAEYLPIAGPGRRRCRRRARGSCRSTPFSIACPTTIPRPARTSAVTSLRCVAKPFGTDSAERRSDPDRSMIKT